MKARKAILGLWLCGLAFGQAVNPGRVNVTTTPWSISWLTHATDGAALTDLGYSAWEQSLVGSTDLADWLTTGGAGVPFVAIRDDATNLAVATTLQLDGWADVRWYGAIADDAGDDSVAVQAALDAVAATGGGVVWMPKGVYIVDGLTMASHIMLAGDPGAVLQKPAASVVNMLSLTGAHDVQIVGLTFDGNGSAQAQPDYAGATYERVIDLHAVSQFAIADCNFIRPSECFLFVHLSMDGSVERCHFSGLMPATTAADWLCDDIQLQGCDRVAVSNCRMTHAKPATTDYGIGAIWTSNCTDLILSNNIATNCGRTSGSGHQVAAIDFYDASHRCTVSTNKLRDCQAWGVRVKCNSPTDGIRIVDNDVNVPDGRSSEPIWVVRTNAAVSDIVIARNRIEGPEDVGGSQVAAIRVQEAAAAGDEPNQVIIAANVITSGEYGVLVEGAKWCIVKDNIIRVQDRAITCTYGAVCACSETLVCGNNIESSRNTSGAAVTLAGTQIDFRQNQILHARWGVILNSLSKSRICENTIESSQYPYLSYTTTGATGVVVIEQNEFVGASTTPSRQVGENIIVRGNRGDGNLAAMQIAEKQFGSMVTVIASVDVDDDASTDDYQFDDDQANVTAQTITLSNILPAYAELVSVQLRCFETVTGSTAMNLKLGTTGGGSQILAAADIDSANDLGGTSAAGSPILAATNAARSVYLTGTPGANWNTLDAGRWVVLVTYLDYGAVKNQYNP